jgi:5-formyltetrahydrofolate cyclo-ligase
MITIMAPLLVCLVCIRSSRSEIMSDSNFSSKTAIRKEVLSKRNGMNSIESRNKSSKIQNSVINLEIYLDATVIGIYLPIGNEVETWRIINHSLLNNKILGLPRVESDNDLRFYRVEEDDLKHNLIASPFFGVKEPNLPKSRSIESIDTLIVPGIVFDRKGSRIGYGFGYYDKYMAKNRYKKSIGLGYDFQIFDCIPSMHSYDQKIDIIVSENEVLFC